MLSCRLFDCMFSLLLVFLVFFCFFFSSRRRHTRCALVTGVQTCALPILDGVDINGTTISATNGSVAKLRQLAVMANVTYDIPLGGNTFKPYVGVGLGAVGSHLKALGEDDGSVRFAWQLRAGAAVKVTKGIDLTADY